MVFLFYPDFWKHFFKQVRQFVTNSIESNFSWCDIVYFRPVCYSNIFNGSLVIFDTVTTLHKIHFSFLIIKNPMNVENWVMISHLCNNYALIRVLCWWRDFVSVIRLLLALIESKKVLMMTAKPQVVLLKLFDIQYPLISWVIIYLSWDSFI